MMQSQLWPPKTVTEGKNIKKTYGNIGSVNGGLMISDILNIVAAKPWYALPQDRKIFSGPGYFRLKRVLDIVISSFLILVVLPVLITCAIVIKIDSPGPVFFVQKRTGYGGKRFKIFKLRTMRKNADKIKEQYTHLSTLGWPDFKIPNDPRITRLGSFLRKTSLDELPQFLNVLLGDMSLVGPRPTSFASSTYDLWHTARLDIKPGITGLWQVSGRSDVEFDDRVRLDVAYIRNVSLALDLKIMFRTVAAVLKKEGAS
jgi:lipopolysaccharide/colanic/teichoic acid biosynthesis glycosyltransferase